MANCGTFVMEVSGLNPHTLEDTLINFLEAKTDTEVEEVRYSQDRCVAWVTFTGKPDVVGIEKVRKKPLGDRYLQVSEVGNTETYYDADSGHVPQYNTDAQSLKCNTYMMRVSGLHPDTSQEDLMNYLESLAEADVEQIIWHTGRHSVFVSFEQEPDLDAMQKKLQKKRRSIRGRIPELSPAEHPAWVSDRTKTEWHENKIGGGNNNNQMLNTKQEVRDNLSGEKSQKPGQAQSTKPRPAAAIAEIPVENQLKTSVSKQAPVRNSRTIQPPAKAQKTTEWSVHRLDDGRVYYYNSTTKISTWDKPAELMGEEVIYQRIDDIPFSKISVTLTSHLTQLIQDNYQAKTFVGHALREWGFEVDGVTGQQYDDKTTFKYHEIKHTGVTYDGLSPSQTESLITKLCPELTEKLFVHGDDHGGKLYMLGECANVSEAMQRLDTGMRTRKLGVLDNVKVKIVLTKDEHLRLMQNEGSLMDMKEHWKGTDLKIQLSDGMVEIEGNSHSVQMAKQKVQEIKQSVQEGASLVPEKIELEDIMLPVDVDNQVIQELVTDQVPVLHYTSIAVSELMATALRKNNYIRTYIHRQFKEMNYHFEMSTNNTVTVGAMSLHTLRRVKDFFFKLVIEKVFQWESEAIWYLRSLNSIKDELLQHKSLGKKVVLSDEPQTLRLICTNESPPSVEHEMDSLRESFLSASVDIPPGVEVTVEECERYVQNDRNMNDKVKVVVDNTTKLTVYAQCDEIDVAVKALGQLLKQKETQIKENDDNKETLSFLEYIDIPEEPSDVNVDIKEHALISTGIQTRQHGVKQEDTLEEDKFISFTDESQQFTSSVSEILDGEDLFVTVTPRKEDDGSPNITKEGQPIDETESISKYVTDQEDSPFKKKTPTKKKSFGESSPKTLKTSNSETVSSGFGMDSEILVKVYKGDITKLDVDVIVSSANGHLSHGAGVSRAIADAAGPELTRDCNYLVNKHGDINVTEVAVTSAGRLPCKKVFHAIGPQWYSYSNKQKCLGDLCHTILRCLCEAEKQKMSSVAISSVSSGIFGVPQESCAKMYIHAVRTFEAAVTYPSLKEVHFVDINDRMVTIIQTELDKPKSGEAEQSDIMQDGEFIEMCLGSSKLSSSAKHIKSPEPKMVSSPSGRDRDCVICISKMTNPKQLPCGHWFCTDCIQRTFQDKEVCPICKTSFDMSLVPQAVLNHTSSLSGKLGANCVICLDRIKQPKRVQCGHIFCTNCIDQCFKVKPVCPICYTVCGEIIGNMPPGVMELEVDTDENLPGYKDSGTIIINYSFTDGIQTGDHPNAGQQYQGTEEIAYLPDNTEGWKILSLLKIAWERQLTFTIENCKVTWRDIHHKTSVSGGPENNGYPDPMYLRQVVEELARVGVTDVDLQIPWC